MVRELRLIGVDPSHPTALQPRLGGRPADRDLRVERTADGSAREALLEALAREVRTALALVSGYSQTLLHLDLADEERGRYLARISVASEHVAELTEEVLSVTASENDGLPQCQAVAISGLLSQLGRQLVDEADPPMLIARVPADLPLVSADPVWIGAVLRILVAATASGSVYGRSVRLEATSTREWVVISAQAGGEQFENETSNSRSPIGPSSHRMESAEQATASGGRAGSSNHRSYLGASRVGDLDTRPGLDFCRKLVEAHGGQLWLNGSGSSERVSISLPRYWAAEAPVQSGSSRRLVGALEP
ncbi:MAG: histidine kinase dimerization/phospho-acceptor domain-containing protein [Candidatus Limnocylindrales bacterium]|jgi:signal transduction histidine kinase